MAERRMFAKTIIDSDAFLDMPLSSQVLYFHLCMRADDEGFINNPKKIQRMVGCNDDDLKLLIAKSFIIPFENGIIVIKHWRLHNYIRKDRFKETVYQEERAMLDEKENGSYKLKNFDSGNQLTANGQPTDNQAVTNPATQVRLGKDSIGKDSIGILPGADGSATEPETDQPVIISMVLNDKSYYSVNQLQVTQWEELYPAVEVEQQLRNMKGWLESNPKKRKTKAGILKFITGWLAREQDKGGRYRNSKPESNQPQWGDPDYYKCDPGDSL